MARLTHSAARVLRQAIVDMSLGVNPSNATTSWQVSAPKELDTPDNVITIGNTSGIQEGTQQATGKLYEGFGIQVRVRATDHDTGWLKANAIGTALAEQLYQRTVVVDGTTYCIHCFNQTGGILETGDDIPNSKRQLFFLNGILKVNQLS